jgi:hypothetical protein
VVEDAIRGFESFRVVNSSAELVALLVAKLELVVDLDVARAVDDEDDDDDASPAALWRSEYLMLHRTLSLVAG